MRSKNTVAQLQMHGGMAYVIQLCDGRFIVIDGGEVINEGCYQMNKRVLYDYLQKRSSVDRIRVACWVITHFHSDHVDVAARFLREHRDELDVESFLYNYAPNVEFFTDDEREEELSREAAWDEAMANYPNATRICPRSGDSLSFGNVNVRVLATALDPYPEKPTNANVISLVMKLTFESGRSFMVLGDATSERLTSLIDPESEIYCTEEMLKSDILQVAHHGLAIGREFEYPSITALYEKIAPRTAFWAINEKRFFTDKWCRDPSKTYHKFLFDTVGKNNYNNSYTTVVDMEDLSVSFEKYYDDAE